MSTFPPPPPGVGKRPGGSRKGFKTALIVGGAVLLAAAGGVGIGMAVSGGGGDEDGAGTTAVAPGPETSTRAETSSSDDVTVSAGPAPEGSMSNADLARASVLIVPSYQGEFCEWSGSGTVVDQEGLILTNFHVVAPDETCPWDRLIIATTDRTDVAPEPMYGADLITFDEGLDLAVIRISTTVDGEPLTEPLGIQPIPLGDSQGIEVGDELRILGYPGIGGETITFTRGSVSGFTTEPGIGTRAWIKTDATIAGGNSGGAAIDASGHLIGVPSVVGSGSGASYTDCRFLEDTNGDGNVDEQDTCVPVGGFINGVRPIHLARALVTGADGAAPVDLTPDDVETVDPELYADARGFNVALAVDGSTPVAGLQGLPSGLSEVCLSFDYENIPAGAVYNVYWSIDGEFSEEQGVLDGTWTLEPSGNAAYCNVEGISLPDGIHETVVTLGAGEQETVLVAESFFVGGDHPPVELGVENLLDVDACYVHVVPAGTSYWGPDRLGEDLTIAPGGSATITVTAGLVDILVQDCDESELFSSTEEKLDADSTLTLSA